MSQGRYLTAGAHFIHGALAIQAAGERRSIEITVLALDEGAAGVLAFQVAIEEMKRSEHTGRGNFERDAAGVWSALNRGAVEAAIRGLDEFAVRVPAIGSVEFKQGG